MANWPIFFQNCTLKKPKFLANLYLVTFATFLCTAFYFLGLWQHPSGTATIAASYVVADNICVQRNSTAEKLSTPVSPRLDFSAHHYSPDPPTTAARKIEFSPCDASLSEYTPCEDVKRSLKFERDRLIYRERHCPTAEEALKCRVPPPYGYKVPVRWPESRDSVWYANVPHKELTIEKKKQNWVQFYGDRFRFPGGGTMFPRGANAYIDDIGKLINLKDGSIRTAIDTGCGVRNNNILKIFLLNRLQVRGLV